MIIVANQIDILQMRFTLPGLGFFAISYFFLLTFRPSGLDLSAQSTWVALGAIGVVGSVPVGYLIHQGYQLWNYMNGRGEDSEHIKEIILKIRSTDSQEFRINDALIIKKDILMKKLRSMGEEYVRRTGVKIHKSEILENGYLSALHNLIFLGNRSHDTVYRRAWNYARVTRAFLGSLILALLAWIPLVFGSNNIIVVEVLISVEFLILMVSSWFVSKYSYSQADIDEKFLLWLYFESGRFMPTRKNDSSPCDDSKAKE